MTSLNETGFASLGLSAPLLRALADEGYETPTPIQLQAIPSVLAGRDLLGIAQTGTGKTAAFALPILQRLAADRKPALRNGCRALILSPTRELASQIAESFRTYGRHMGMSVAVVFGGVPMPPQTRALAHGVDVLVATPGRLLDHMQQHHAKLASTEIFVLDEADQMLDLGFVVPIRKIVKTLAARRQNLFFSATMPKEIGVLASELLSDPVRVAITPAATTVERVTQQVILVETRHKRALLVELFADETVTRSLVFTRTKRGADKVAHALTQAGVDAAAIHGNKSQSQRTRALDAFKRGQTRVLVATDIAARGIDVDAVSHVVNFELPNVPESYVHRIGRTARAGADGIAISFCDHEERALLRDIERATRQKLPVTDRMRDAGLAAATGAEPANGRRDGNGGRPAHAHRGGPSKNGQRSNGHAHHGHANNGQRSAKPASGGWDPAREQHRERPARDGGREHEKGDGRAHAGHKPAAAHAKGPSHGKGGGHGRPHAHAHTNGAGDLSRVAFMGEPKRRDAGRNGGKRPSR